MSITEQIIGRLGSEGTYSFLTASALIAAMLILPSDVDKSVFVPPTKPYYKAIEASDPSIPACQISAWDDAEKLGYHPKTALGKRLMALRNRAIAKGLSLLDAEEIVEEVRRRRGEVA